MNNTLRLRFNYPEQSVSNEITNHCWQIEAGRPLEEKGF